jgi:DNA-directed RNA polymerase subunit beta
MGSNMQKQATPCIIPEAPLVATGIEEKAARDTGRIILLQKPETLLHVDAKKIVLKRFKSGKEKEYNTILFNFSRTNGFTAFHQRPTLIFGDKSKEGRCSRRHLTSDGGQMALVKTCSLPSCHGLEITTKTPLFFQSDC